MSHPSLGKCVARPCLQFHVDRHSTSAGLGAATSGAAFRAGIHGSRMTRRSIRAFKISAAVSSIGSSANEANVFASRDRRAPRLRPRHGAGGRPVCRLQTRGGAHLHFTRRRNHRRAIRQGRCRGRLYLAVLGAPRRHVHSARTGATRLRGGLQIHQRLAMARTHAKNRRRIFELVSVSPGSAGICCRDAQAAQRLGVDLFQHPSRCAQDQAAEFPYRGGSRERNRGELSLDGRQLARRPLSRHHLVG